MKQLTLSLVGQDSEGRGRGRFGSTGAPTLAGDGCVETLGRDATALRWRAEYWDCGTRGGNRNDGTLFWTRTGRGQCRREFEVRGYLRAAERFTP